jgi:TonB family protein
MRPVFFVVALLLVCSCAAPPPPPLVAPELPAPAPAVPAEEVVSGTVRVTASALNVRREPAADAEVIAQVKKGTSLGVLQSDESWMKVRLADGSTGWVAERFVAREGASQKKRATAKRGSCPADSDFAFLETPVPSFSDRGAHGLVIVEASVNTKGTVTSTKVVSNATGDEALAFLAAREIQSAKFSPPIRDCGPRSFVYTYRKMF